LRLVGLGVLIGFLMPDGTACERANDAMMASYVSSCPANHGTLDAAFRLCRHSRANHEQEQRNPSQQFGHLVLLMRCLLYR
jgi:hypothetical protein